MNPERDLGLVPLESFPSHRDRIQRMARLQLRATGLPAPTDERSGEVLGLVEGVLQSYAEKNRRLSDQRCAADRRIESFLQRHCADLKLPSPLRLPDVTIILDRHSIARQLSIPAIGHKFSNSLLTSIRVANGVLHNPKSDRRTTQGTFHVTEGGLPIPGDKKAVPKGVFAELFRHAMNPPAETMTLPFTADEKEPARSFVSLLLRPTICPEVPGICSKKSMEVRFFAPGSLVSNLDFVESIFGNAGDPFLPENDSGLDVEHWSGHTGCVIVVPHLTAVTKKELGLPPYEKATARQRRDGMCWKSADEKYNDGVGFKVTCRTDEGVIVTLIADNYYGYCKKEVKTQISYAANLFGNVEEEHAGGALAFPSLALGDEYNFDSRKSNGRTWDDVVRDFGQYMNLQPEGYGIDKQHPQVIYVPHDTNASVPLQKIWWHKHGKEQSLRFEPDKIYITPSGFKLRLEKHPGAPSWRIIGTSGQGTYCHKPCTVSGGGKSEISKSLLDFILYGPIFVTDIEKDLDLVDQIFKKDYSGRWAKDNKGKPSYAEKASRPILSRERSLGSVIKLLTPSSEYSDEYNKWLESIPNYVYPIVFIIKRFYHEDWKGDWRSRFNVDIVNGFPGHELKFGERKLVGFYLRVGLRGKNAWRTYKLRQDFAAAAKVQTEDDISASVVVPADQLLKADQQGAGAYKFVVNCEYRLFQRPDEAIHRGLDKQTEADLSRPDNFISNFEPLAREQAQELVAQVTEFDRFTAPMQKILRTAANDGEGYVVSSAHPRIVDGKPTKNPRYLQNRPDMIDPIPRYVAERGIRFFRAIPADQPLVIPVDAVLMGRRNNPAEPDAGVRALAVYNPIHYQELPELFMDFISSLTGKSPSTTGAGSEGALTKGPFNAVMPAIDLNNALVSYILTGLGGFSTAAGYVGPTVRVDHDISLLVPEIWCRLTPEERDPKNLIANGHLEPLKDFEHNGEKILASRLGYRITANFIRSYFGRVFDNPSKVFDESILKPELQSREQFIDGIKNITEAQQRVAREYMEDGGVDLACPPLKALLHIMASGSFEGKDVQHPDIRAMFTREYLLKSDWYQKRLKQKQERDIALWKRHVEYLQEFTGRTQYQQEASRLEISQKLKMAQQELQRVSSAAYLQSLRGTLGADPMQA